MASHPKSCHPERTLSVAKGKSKDLQLPLQLLLQLLLVPQVAHIRSEASSKKYSGRPRACPEPSRGVRVFGPGVTTLRGQLTHPFPRDAWLPHPYRSPQRTIGWDERQGASKISTNVQANPLSAPGVSALHPLQLFQADATVRHRPRKRYLRKRSGAGSRTCTRAAGLEVVQFCSSRHRHRGRGRD